jgi:hypothetical protein
MFEGGDSFLKVVSGSALVMKVSKVIADTYRLGFEDREYSYSPIGFPTAVCANVVDSEICLGQLRTLQTISRQYVQVQLQLP